MRICVLSEYFYPDSTGGTGAVLSSVIRCLRDQHPDVEIDVLASRNLFRGEVDALSVREDWDGISIFRLRAPRPHKRSVRRRLGANMVFTSAVLRHLMLSRRRYDAVLVVTAPPTLPMAAHAYRKLTGTPYLYLVYDLYLDLALALQIVQPESKMVRQMHKVQKSWFNDAGKVVVLGRCMRDFVQKRYGTTNEQTEVIPIPSNVELVASQQLDSQFRREHDLSGFVVLYAGNFAQYQDFDTLLEAAKTLQHRRDITWVFVGDGHKRPYIEERVQKEQLANVRLLPFVPEDQLCDMLASANVSLVTLENGTSGLAVPSKFYNILASGRPTVAVIEASSEIARAITEHECGVCIAPADANSLAQALCDLADDTAKTTQMGHNARRAAEEIYALPLIARRFYETLQKTAESKSSLSKRSRERQLTAAEIDKAVVLPAWDEEIVEHSSSASVSGV